MRKGKKLLIIFFILISFPLFSINLKEEVRKRKFPVYIVKDTEFISLNSFLKIINCESWGRIEDRVFIIYNGKEIKFRIGDENIIVGGELKTLKSPPKEVEGEILIPLDDFSNIISSIKSEEEKAPEIQSEESTKKSKGKFIILIDPGHGGKDTGAIGNFGLKEKDVNLDVALRLKDFLKRNLKDYPDIKIYMTREKDVYLSLEDRVQMAKDLNADMFFCIHTNSSRYNRYNASGFETYYPRMKKEIKYLTPPENLEEDNTISDTVVLQIVKDLNETTTIDESKILAEIVQEKLSERLLTPDRGAKPANFYVLKYTPMISILTEIGFICNPNIELNLRDVEVRQAIANELGTAIIEYLKLKTNFWRK